MSEPVLHHGGCHCGAVRYTVHAPARIVAQSCNCSICARTGFLHLIVPAAAFTLESGHDALTEYTFNSRVAKHLFCRVCGIKSFYRPRSNPDGWSINVHCLDPGTVTELTVEAFDGQNWEANAAALAHLSK